MQRDASQTQAITETVFKEIVVTSRFFTLGLSVFAATSLMAAAEGVPPGPPAVEIAGTVDANVVNTVDANVVNTVDTNVVNTVDANLVSTVSGETLRGVSLGPSVLIGAGVFFFNPAKLHAMSVSVASVNPGEICNVFVEMGSEPADTSLEPIGLSLLSNGQAETVSTTYEIPIEPVWVLNYEITETVDCYVSFSIAYEELDTEGGFAPSAEGEQRVHIELR